MVLFEKYQFAAVRYSNWGRGRSVDPDCGRANRLGISLLEILISVGIVSIGLVAVASLIPLAHYKAMKGLQKDRASELAQRAMREFHVREFDQPNHDAPHPWFPNDLLNLPFSNPNFLFDSNSSPGSFCFDPLFIANNNDAASNLDNLKRLVYSFPRRDLTYRFSGYDPTNDSQAFFVRRVTALELPLADLRIVQNAISVAKKKEFNDFLIANTDNWKNWPIIRHAQAEQLCGLPDDLVYQNSEDSELPRYQEYRDVDKKRMSAGNYSWMATIVPDSGFVAGIAVFASTNRYRLSIAVLDRRNYDTFSLPQAKPNQEIIARVILHGGPFNKKNPSDVPSDQNSLTSDTASTTQEIQIELPNPNYDAKDGATFEELTPGNWLLIAQDYDDMLNTSNLGIHTLRWYKVASQPEPASESPGKNKSLVMTISGAPIIYSVADADEVLQPIRTYAIFVNNVVTVVEKTVSLKK